MYGRTTLRNAVLRHIPIKVSGIYKITNTVDGKFYIGSAVDVRKRLRHHLIHLRKGEHTSTHLQHAFNRDGESVFSIDLVELVPAGNLYDREQHWLDSTRCYDDTIGYNICKIAGPPPKTVYTPEMRAAISRKFKNKPKSEEHRKKIGAAIAGQTRSPEVRAKVSAGLKAFWERNPELKAAQSKKMLGHQVHPTGVPLTDDVKRQLSEKAKIRYQDPLHRAKLRKFGQKGALANKTPESRARRSAATKGKPLLKNRKYSDEQMADWQRQRDSGLGYKAISENVGVDVATIHRWLTKNGKTGKTKETLRKYTQDDATQWALMRSTGMSYTKIAQISGVNRATIYDYLNRHPRKKPQT